MQLPIPQNYLLKTRANLAYLFYMNKDRTISAKLFSEDNQVMDEEIITPKGMLDFSVTIDLNDYIHLICIDQDGALLYYIRQKNQWSHRQISKLDIKSNHYKNLLILIKNKETHVFCNKTNLTNPMVASIEHMYWNDKNINKKTVSNYLPGKYPSPLQIDFDSQGNVHLIYKVLYKNNHQLYYNFFNAFNKKWSSPEMVTSLQEDHSHPHILIDNKDNLHLVWCTIEENNFTVKYKRKLNVVNYKSKWGTTKTLSDPNSNSLSPVLIQDGSTLMVLTRQTNQIVEIYSGDFGTHWSPSTNHRYHKIDNPIMVKYITNNDFEKISVAISQCYCEITDQIKIIGTKLFKSIDPIEPPQSLPASSDLQNEVDSGGSSDTNSNLTVEVTDDQAETEVNIINTPLTESSLEAEPAEPPLEEPKSASQIEVDASLKDLVQGVQQYINQMMLEVEKLEAKKIHIPAIHSEEKDIETDTNKIEGFYSELADLNQELLEIESQQLLLQKELNNYQKRIYEIEDRMVFFKKHIMEIESRLTHLNDLSPGFMSRIKNLFK